jgi:DNA-binding response OmpR family regulator
VTADHSKKVLIVDDEPDICILLSRKLQRKGFDAAYALSLNEGIERFEEIKPGYLILDHNLPDGLGLDNLERFRTANPKVKIIVISAMGHLREKAHQAGADLFMSKPLSFKDIEEYIGQ